MTLLPSLSKQLKSELALAYRNDLSELLQLDDPFTFRERVVKLEQKMLMLPEVYIPIEHHFAGGIYARTMLAKKGTLIVGKIYKKDQMVILNQGDISIRSEFFNGRIQGPWFYESPRGAKRVGFCHTDVVWTCLTATNAKTVEEAEKEIYAESYEELDRLLMDDSIICVGG